jgi:GT2 family glycosyltransferase
MTKNVFVTAVLRPDFIERMVETLYRYTDNFKLVVVDQTPDGLPDIKGVHLRIRPYRNLGFAKAMNEGMVHGLHWKSDFIACINDDVEFINKRWWDGIMQSFEDPSDREVLVVNPESVRIPLWGYGRPPSEYVEILDYKENFTEEDYDFLLKGDFTHLKSKYPDLPESFPTNYVGVADGIAAWGPVFKRKALEVIGLFEERFYPGGAEDYDYMGRVYSKGYRAISTRKSWVWHWWGKTHGNDAELKEKHKIEIDPKYRWSNLSYLWPKEWNEGHELDIWGKYKSKDGTDKTFRRRKKIGIVEI